MTENPSPEPLAGGAHVTPTDGGGTVESPTLSLADLNKHLGSDFKDASTALKALKDTKDFVGKRKEDIAAEVKASITPAVPADVASKSDVQALKNELFYSQNPQYKPYESMIAKLGGNPAEVVNSDDFKGVFEKVKTADEVANSRSVVSSNSRLSQNKTVTDQAIAVANARGSTNEDLAITFARAINEQNAQG